jgi:hypothetical protein
MLSCCNAIVSRGWFDVRMQSEPIGSGLSSVRVHRSPFRRAELPEEHVAHDAAGRRIVRRVYAGAMGEGALAFRAREGAISEVCRSLAQEPPPGLGVLRRVDVDDRHAALVYDAHDGSLADLLEDTRAPGNVTLPLPTIVGLRAVLVAAACTVTCHDLHGLRLRRGSLSPTDVVLLGDVPYVQMSAFDAREPDVSDDVSTASFGEVLAQCLTGTFRAAGLGAFGLATLRPGLPEAVCTTAGLLLDAPRGVDALAERYARGREEVSRLLGKLVSPRAYVTEAPRDLVKWQLSLLVSLDHLGADDEVDRYFAERAGSWHSQTPDFQSARRAWASCRRLPVAFATEQPLPRVMAVDRDVATAFLARARRAVRDADPATAFVAWRQAAAAAPGDPDVWIEFAKLWGSADCEEAEAFGLAEALCCARGDAAAVRSLTALIGAGSAAGLARYFAATGHRPIAAWLAASHG